MKLCIHLSIILLILGCREGRVGPQGKPGLPGKDGVSLKGETGEKGDDGLDGEKGVNGINNASTSEWYDIVWEELTLPNGENAVGQVIEMPALDENALNKGYLICQIRIKNSNNYYNLTNLWQSIIFNEASCRFNFDHYFQLKKVKIYAVSYYSFLSPFSQNLKEGLDKHKLQMRIKIISGTNKL